MFSKLLSMGVWGVNAYCVDVETSACEGMPSLDVVGLPDASVRESRDRVRAALKNSGFNLPNKKVTVNLAPANIRKEGTVYDLPILLGLLSATKQLAASFDGCAFVGELSLSGEVRPVKGLLPMAVTARDNGINCFFVPAQQAAQAAIVGGIEVYPVENVTSLVEHLREINPIKALDRLEIMPGIVKSDFDFSEVAGHEYVKRAVEIACAGGHNMLLIGPPGSGKSMIAKRIPSILPDMNYQEAIEATCVHSVAGVLPDSEAMLTTRPFRSPHHTVSSAALTGGGSNPVPGEISLAHNGVLFLDELPEFQRTATEALRAPLEDGKVTVSRVSGSVTFPCSTMFVAAMNPCPCGYYGHPTKKCTCSKTAVSRYMGRISGPLLDRIDIQVEVPSVSYGELTDNAPSLSSAEMKERVNAARRLQASRFKDKKATCNALLPPRLLREVCVLDNTAEEYLKNSFDKLNMSGRGYDRVLKVSRTIADLDDSEIIKKEHIARAIRFRTLDRKYTDRD